MTDVPEVREHDGDGSPVGRRVVLGMLGLGALGVAAGNTVWGAVSSVAAQDPTGLTAAVPGGSGFRYFTVTGRVDEVPQAQYSLAVSPAPGAPPVDVPYAELASLRQTTLVKDVQCVTGWRVPTVRWTGVLLSDLLKHVGADVSSPGVSFASFDGAYTESLTMRQALRPDVLIATHMLDKPVTHDHGGPVRLYVAPMYFYKSLKWLESVSVVDAVTPGYWEQRGYDVDAWVGSSNGMDDAPIT